MIYDVPLVSLTIIDCQAEKPYFHFFNFLKLRFLPSKFFLLGDIVIGFKVYLGFAQANSYFYVLEFLKQMSIQDNNII
jgi:hypothetical protein